MSTARVRRPAVAGRFYPSEPEILSAIVDDALSRTDAVPGATPEALVVPHAGYPYSGDVAARAYGTLRAGRRRVRRVVLVGPAHLASVDGVATTSVDGLVTPLGTVPVDASARRRACAMPGVTVDDDAHASEHCLEVQLPFLQRALDDFAVLPLLVGRADPELLADVLDSVWEGPETLVVVSTDLSHFLTHDEAVARDRATADAILRGDVAGLHAEDACGAAPVRGLLVAAGRRGLVARLLDLRTSADASGDRDRVVGYGAFAFEPVG